MNTLVFKDRTDAGKQLALLVKDLKGEPDLVVLALPRGGVPVAHQIANYLKAPLEILVVRKLGVPGHSELAMGALGSNGFCFLDKKLIKQLKLSKSSIQKVIALETKELNRQKKAFHRSSPPTDLTGKTLILIDDGLATGATMLTAVRTVKQARPKKIMVAVPVASSTSAKLLAPYIDFFFPLLIPEHFHSVGTWYLDFTQVTDNEVEVFLAVSF